MSYGNWHHGILLHWQNSFTLLQYNLCWPTFSASKQFQGLFKRDMMTAVGGTVAQFEPR
ncbi:MAG: Uncharacterised protein [Pseudidiomarina mangrovi]|nr:MAG: Uncharacterised protein [Pseudidiomarina mangrovi]